jgi:tetratricopeptide (TPR) repeat protein
VACAYFHKGLLDQAESALEKVASLGAFSGWGEAYLGLVHLAQGRETEARDILRAMIEKRRHAHVSPWCIGALAGALGDPNRAFEYLDAAYEERDPLMPFINVFPEVEPLRPDPRFKALLERMRLG